MKFVNMKNKAIAAILAIIMLAGVFSAPVLAWEASDWAVAEVQKSEDMGLIPESLQDADLKLPVNRADFAAVAVKLYEVLTGKEAVPVEENPFDDTDDDYVLKAYGLGITDGVAVDKFAPDSSLTREMAATMLTRVWKIYSMPNWTLKTDGDFDLLYVMPELFADDDKISGWAKDSVYFMAANEIVGGVGGNRFAPNTKAQLAGESELVGLVTCEQALAIAVRMAETFKVEEKEAFWDFDWESLADWSKFLNWPERYDNLRRVTPTDEAAEIALSDFEYLADMILEVSPTINIAERRLGVSMRAFLAFARQHIIDKTPIPSFSWHYMGDEWLKQPKDPLDLAADYLFSLLTLIMFDLDDLSHMHPYDVFEYEQEFIGNAFWVHNEKELLALGYSQADIDSSKLHYDIFNTPSARRLYGINPNDYDLSFDSWGGIAAFEEDNLSATMIGGRIAYLYIESFFNNVNYDIELIYNFFQEIQDYEHLIIDIRGNGGGWASYFPLLVELLIGEPIEFEYPEFYRESELTAGYYENPVGIMGGTLVGVYPAAEFAEAQNMTEFNQDDLDLLDYVMVWRIVLEPIEGDSVGFEGEIWLLVDEWSASASEIAAKIAVNTGFATVVGEPTAGVSGVTYTFAALPKTGIIFRIDIGYTTDNYGRSFEEFGVIPDIANKPGFDALMTVFELIGITAEDLENIVEFPMNYGELMAGRIDDYISEWLDGKTINWKAGSEPFVDDVGFVWVALGNLVTELGGKTEGKNTFILNNIKLTVNPDTNMFTVSYSVEYLPGVFIPMTEVGVIDGAVIVKNGEIFIPFWLFMNIFYYDE